VAGGQVAARLVADHDHLLGAGGQLVVEVGVQLAQLGLQRLRVGGVGGGVRRVGLGQGVGDLVGDRGETGRVEPEVRVGAQVAVAVVVGVGVLVVVVGGLVVVVVAGR